MLTNTTRIDENAIFMDEKATEVKADQTSRQRAIAGSGSFRLTPNGRTQYRANCIDMYGCKVRKTFTGDSKEECLEKARAFEEHERIKAQGIPIDATIPELVRRRYDLDLAMNFSHVQGYYRNLETLKIIERSGLGKMRVIDIRKPHIQMFLMGITHYANATIEKIFQQLKLGFSEAINQDIIQKDLMLDRDIRRPKSVKPTKKVRAFSMEEQRMIVEALWNHKVPYGRQDYRYQLLLEIYTGLRMGEINSLRPMDIDFEHRLIYVSRTISKGEGTDIFINNVPKTEAGNRAVPMSENAERVIREALARMKRNKDGLIFYDFNMDRPVTTNQVNSFFKRICGKLGIECDGQHALRHTFATRCVESDIKPEILKNWLGHTDIHITIDIYTDVFEEQHRSAIKKFDEHLALN